MNPTHILLVVPVLILALAFRNAIWGIRKVESNRRDW